MRELVCPKCSKNFSTNHSFKKFCSSKCQVQNANDTFMERRSNDIRLRCSTLIASAKNRSKSKGLNYNLSLDYVVNLWEEQEGKCKVSGILFDTTRSVKHGEPAKYSPSIDRIKPELGYTKGNIRLVIFQINIAIGPYGLEQFLELCKIMNEVG